MCKLSLKIDGAWLTKCDVGGQSEQPDDGDRAKSAHSDALKRAAAAWGIGRYFSQTHSAMGGIRRTPAKGPSRHADTAAVRPASGPNGTAAGPASGPNGHAAGHGHGAWQNRDDADHADREQRQSRPAGVRTGTAGAAGGPRSRHVRRGACKRDDLVAFVRAAGKDHYGPDLARWDSPEAIKLAAECTRTFDAARMKAA